MNKSVDIFRRVAFAEGISYLVLLFIAMPLKYGLDMPLAVKYVGWAHGVLFVAYIVFGGLAALKDKWSLQFSAVAFIASLIPFGTFWLDKKLAKDS
ncbi:MAG: DUF3817 domain-containing protein [Myxococcota bacterium]|nr:DUF3817 domain-containing protein [Myxococcota bacterium]